MYLKIIYIYNVIMWLYICYLIYGVADVQKPDHRP